MKITFTKQQYRTLLLITHLGDWIVNSHKTDLEGDEVSELYHYILSHHKEFGESELVDHEAIDGKYYGTRNLDDWAHPFIEDYDDDTFWDELTFRLARRDFVKRNGAAKVSKMRPEQRMEGMQEFEDYYAEEFEANGIDNLRIAIDPFRAN